MPRGDRLVVVMSANARAGRTRDGCSDTNVVSAYGRATLKDNGKRLSGFAEDNKISVADTFFSTPKGGDAHISNKPKAGRDDIGLTTMLIDKQA